MANVNKVILIGRLTRDPELRYTPSQTPVTELGIAVNRQFGGGDEGERREETTFLDVTVWDRQAENCCQYLSKGRSVYVEGYLKLDTWEDKNNPGEKRSKLRVIAQTVQFLDGRRDESAPRGEASFQPRSSEPRRSSGPSAPRATTNTPPRRADAAPEPAAAQSEDDIPF